MLIEFTKATMEFDGNINATTRDTEDVKRTAGSGIVFNLTHPEIHSVLSWNYVI